MRCCSNRFTKIPLALLALAVLTAFVAPQAAIAQTSDALIQQAAGVAYPATVTVGSTVAVQIATTNATIPGPVQTSVTIRLPANTVAMTHQVSCKTNPGGLCAPGDLENPAVFTFNSPDVDAGTAGIQVAGAANCAGVNLTVAATGNPGEYTFTPLANVDLLIGQSCLVNFTVHVDKLPTVDADLVAAGIQTNQRNGAVGVVSASNTGANVGQPTSGTGPDSTTVQAVCEIQVDKQFSCSGPGGPWFDQGLISSSGADGVVGFCSGFAAINGRPADQIYVRYLYQKGANTSPGVAFEGCTLTDLDQNGAVAWTPPAVDESSLNAGGLVTSAPVFVGDCSLALDDEEPNTASLSCDCAIDSVVFDNVTASDSARFFCDTCSVSLLKDVSCDGGAFGNYCSGFAAFNGTPASDIDVRYTPTNTGTVNLDCNGTLSNDAQTTLGLTDTNTDHPATGVNAGGSNAPGPFGPFTVDSECKDNPNEPDSATILCECLNRSGQPTGITVSASDPADYDCFKPDLTVQKICDPQVGTGNDVRIEVCEPAAATAALTNCQVTDTYFPEDPFCDDGTTGASSPLVVNPNGFALTPGQCVQVTGTINGLTSDTCNTVSVTCDVVGSSAQITRTDEDECEVQGEDCLTRTPGFWGTHPAITQLLLPLDNCGVAMTNTVDSVQGSAIEDMCSVGTDPKTNNVYDQQVQLERQCMAAVLNVAATSQYFESSCDNAYPGVAELISECCTQADSVCRSSLAPGDLGVDGRTINSCIGALDAFNNNDQAEPEDLSGSPFAQPGPADPGECQDSKNNGFLNARPRAATCKGKNCP